VAPPDARYAFPPEWNARVVALREDWEPITSIADPFANDAAHAGAGGSEALSQHYRSDEITVRVALAIESEIHPDLLMVYLPGIDKVSHALWGGFEDPSLYPEELRGSPEHREAQARALESYYEFSDALVGLLSARFDSSDLVIVVSDHGFEADVVELAQGTLTGGHTSHRAMEGIVFARGRGIEPGDSVWGMSVYDVTPTVLAWLGIPAGQDMQGRRARFLEAQPPPPVATHDAGPVERLEAGPSSVEDAIVEQLRALGYVEESESP
jgi:hypothetical protein